MNTSRKKLLALALIPLLAAALAWLLLARYHRKDYTDYFLSRSRPAMVAGSIEYAGPKGLRRDITITVNSGIEFNASVRFPPGRGPFPAAVCLAGYRTGRDAVDLIPPCPMVVAALDYPYDKSKKIRGFKLLSETPNIRRALLDTPSAAVALLHYVETLPQVDPRRTVVVGVSVGGPFALAAAATEERFDGAIIGYACGNLPLWTRINLDDIPRIFRRPVGRLIAELAHPLEPLRYAHRISPRPLLIISSREDPFVPQEEVLRLYMLAGDPKSLRWVSGPHVKSGRTDLLDQLTRLAVEWISETI